MNTLITFKTGRGGRFHNGGHVSVIDTDKPIGSYTDALFIQFPNIRHFSERYGFNTLCELANDAAIGDDSALDKIETLFGITAAQLGSPEYYTGTGEAVGLLVDNDGTGSIDIDGIYNTITVKQLSDCTEDELRLVLDYTGYKPAGVDEFCMLELGVEPEQED